MKPIIKHRGGVSAGWLVTMVAAVMTAVWGCSHTTGPPERAHGTISLTISADAPEGAADVGSETGSALAVPAQVTLDSVVVRVFRAGSGVQHEKWMGAAWDGVSSLDLTVTCIAEADKKVSVELFEGPNMMYFGVEEHVDVVEDENTDVQIDAWDIFIDRIDVSPQMVVEGAAFTVSWSSTRAAGSYLVQQSTSPDFDHLGTQSIILTDTLMTGPVAPGAYFYRVAPLNAYAVGTFTPVAAGYVAATGETPPTVSEVDPPEAAPGDRVTLRGTNLDLPGSRVTIGNESCTVLSATENEMTIGIAPAARTGTITLHTLMGSVQAPGTFIVDRIAYVTRTRQYSDWYLGQVAAEPTISSGVAVVDLAVVADRDMSVFDVIIVAHDVGTGFPSSGNAEMQVIAASGAQVLGVGRGGLKFVASVFDELNGLGVTTELRRDLFIPDGSLPIFQAPYLIAPVGSDIVTMSQSDQWFTGIDIGTDLKPVYVKVTFYASLSVSTPESFALLDAQSLGTPYPVHNFYWGYEGDPVELTDAGRQCVVNILNLLVAEKASVPAESVR
jgi:hypothetical protein